METVAAPHRKLIDIKPAVFDGLSKEAARQGVSLKRYIEDLLEQACPRPSLEVSPKILRLIGSAKPSKGQVEEIDDDRLQYLLSK